MVRLSPVALIRSVGRSNATEPAALACGQRTGGNVEATHLTDAGHYLEQAVIHIEPRLPPQAGIDGRRRFFIRQESVGLEAPDRTARFRGYLRILEGAEKPAR